jgi:hypothetical protein
MEYRSTNGLGKYVHFGGAVIAGAEFGSGIELNPNSSGSNAVITAVGDETNKGITLAGKGTGATQLGNSSAVVRIGTSTTGFASVQMALLQFTIPALSTSGTAGSAADSTVTFAGATTNSIYFLQQRTNWNSTQTLNIHVAARSSAADEITLTFTNTGASSLSGSTASGYLLQFKP